MSPSTRFDAVEVEVVGVRVAAAAELGDDVGVLGAAGTERARRARDQHPVAAERAGDRDDVQAGCAATRDQHALGGVDAVLDGDRLDRLDHLLAGKGENRRGRLLDRRLQRRGGLADHAAGRLDVELHAPAEERLRVDIAEDDGRIGHGRPCRRRARSKPDQGRRPRSAGRHAAGRPRRSTRSSAPGADRAHVDGGDTQVVADELLDQPGFTRVLDVSVADQADIERRSASVDDDHVGAELVVLRVCDPGQGCHRGARLAHVDRALDDLVQVHNAAARSTDQQLAAETGRLEIVAERAQMLLHQRLERSVYRRRGGARVLAHDRVQLVRERERHVGQELADQLADQSFVLAVNDRPEEADGDRLDVSFPEFADDLACGCPVERRLDSTLRVDPLGNLVGQVAGNVGLGKRPPNLKRIALAALAQDEDVTEALGHDRRRLGDLRLGDRVSRARGSIGDDAGAREQLGRLGAERARRVGQPDLEAAVGLLGVGQALAHGEIAGRVTDDDVRERSAHVDRHAICGRAIQTHGGRALYSRRG